jgi:hypothetical protein
VLRGPVDARKARRKTTSEKLQRGSVGMRGQQITICLFEELSQSAQGLVRFKYEVMTKRSPYFGKVPTSARNEDRRCGRGTPIACASTTTRARPAS